MYISSLKFTFPCKYVFWHAEKFGSKGKQEWKCLLPDIMIGVSYVTSVVSFRNPPKCSHWLAGRRSSGCWAPLTLESPSDFGFQSFDSFQLQRNNAQLVLPVPYTSLATKKYRYYISGNQKGRTYIRIMLRSWYFLF